MAGSTGTTRGAGYSGGQDDPVVGNGMGGPIRASQAMRFDPNSPQWGKNLQAMANGQIKASDFSPSGTPADNAAKANVIDQNNALPPDQRKNGFDQVMAANAQAGHPDTVIQRGSPAPAAPAPYNPQDPASQTAAANAALGAPTNPPPAAPAPAGAAQAQGNGYGRHQRTGYRPQPQQPQGGSQGRMPGVTSDGSAPQQPAQPAAQQTPQQQGWNSGAGAYIAQQNAARGQGGAGQQPIGAPPASDQQDYDPRRQKFAADSGNY